LCNWTVCGRDDFADGDHGSYVFAGFVAGPDQAWAWPRNRCPLSVRDPTIGGMGLPRYRRPSLRNLTGHTRVKRRVQRQLGISQVQAWTKPSRVKQRAKQLVGYHSPAARVVRNTAKGRFTSVLGLFGKKTPSQSGRQRRSGQGPGTDAPAGRHRTFLKFWRTRCLPLVNASTRPIDRYESIMGAAR